MRDLVEKPPQDEAPSDLAIIGRYVLTPDIFPALAATKSDRTGEIQLTNGLRELLKTRPIYACEVKGVRHDTGNKLGFLKAVVYFALRRPDLADKFSRLPRRRSNLTRRPASARSRSRALRRRARRLDGVASLPTWLRRGWTSTVEAVAGVGVFSALVALLVFVARRTSPSTSRRCARPSSSFAAVDFGAGALVLLRVVGDVPAVPLN